MVCTFCLLFVFDIFFVHTHWAQCFKILGSLDKEINPRDFSSFHIDSIRFTVQRSGFKSLLGVKTSFWITKHASECAEIIKDFLKVDAIQT